ncbi:MAG: DNA-processing protein DprA, partial [Muribaculaceae bacterium]|nr:DNA-processing protein DprA [Muribaculaceae bacterium]
HGGMLVTDYKSSDKIHRGSFLARNRIIAGLSDCTIVVESARKGGSLATAGIASAYGRDVFAVPGRISDQYSVGCNQLIASNIAAILTDPSDLIAAMRWPIHKKIDTTPTLPLAVSTDEEAIITFLRDNESATTNRISVSLNIPIGKLLSMLIDLEFRGVLAAIPGGQYRLL